jgi:hypothetical protein
MLEPGELAFAQRDQRDLGAGERGVEDDQQRDKCELDTWAVHLWWRFRWGSGAYARRPRPRRGAVAARREQVACGYDRGDDVAVDETADDAVGERWPDVPDPASEPRSAAARTGARTGLPRFASSLRELASRHDVDETLQLAVDLASELIVGCDLADVMFWQAGGATTPVSTDPLALALDAVQAEAGEGPCVLAATAEPIVVANDLANDDRFPVFGPRAATLGARSALSYQLFPDREQGARLGAMNVYGRRTDAFDADAVEIGAVFATHCATVLAAVIAREGFEAALASRDVIGQAKGILMERHRLTATGAFELLRQGSQELNVKLREVAQHVVDTGVLP